MTDGVQARERMVIEQLEARGIRDTRVLQAMRDVPRERFVDPELVSEAYADRPLPIPEGQTISQPFMVAFMAEAAAIEVGDRILEIGAGSGYAAAVLSHLATRVWTLERNQRLARYAGSRISGLGRSNVTVLRADGAEGWAPAAPFDAIVVSACATHIPDALKLQLVIGGRLVIPVGDPAGEQRLLRLVRTAADAWTEEDLGAVRFVPMTDGPGES